MVDVGSEAGLGNDGDHVIDLDVSRLSGGVRPGAPHMLEIGSAICGFCSTIHMYAFS